MANKYKMAEKFAKPIADILYQRGFRKIDTMIDVVSMVINDCIILSDEEKKGLIAQIEKQIKEYHYD